MMACAIADITRHANPPLAKYSIYPWKNREEVALALPATPRPHLTILNGKTLRILNVSILLSHSACEVAGFRDNFILVQKRTIRVKPHAISLQHKRI
jgi:hypothetical protein